MIKSPYPKYVYERNSHIYKALASPKRLEILNTIKNHEVSVEDLASVLGVRISNVSQHLTILKTLRLVTVRKVGHRSFYRLSDPAIVAPCEIFRRLWERQSKISA